MKNKTFLISLFALIILTLSSYNTEDNNNNKQTRAKGNNKRVQKTSICPIANSQNNKQNEDRPLCIDNGDGTITDSITGLTWQKGYGIMTNTEAINTIKAFNDASKTEWRLPSAKEIHSQFSFKRSHGNKHNNAMKHSCRMNNKQFVDKTLIDFTSRRKGGKRANLQILTSNNDTITSANNNIKNYPTNQNSDEKYYMVKFVQGEEYGLNEFVDNKDKTISDKTTGLMWEKGNSENKMNREDAYEYTIKMNKMNYLGHSDWRVPSIMELQSIVDYSNHKRASSCIALNSIFDITANDNNMKYWATIKKSNANLENKDNYTMYICFGESMRCEQQTRPGQERSNSNGNPKSGHKKGINKNYKKTAGVNQVSAQHNRKAVHSKTKGNNNTFQADNFVKLVRSN